MRKKKIQEMNEILAAKKGKKTFFYITKKSHVLDQENVAKAVTKYERPKMKMSEDLTTLGLPEDYCASKGASS